jgi:hypothetical protein
MSEREESRIMPRFLECTIEKNLNDLGDVELGFQQT